MSSRVYPLGFRSIPRRRTIAYTAAGALALAWGAVAPAVASGSTAAYALTGEYVFTVPAGVTTVDVLAIGGAGGNGKGQSSAPGSGGLPGRVAGGFSVFPGEKLYVEVAGAGASSGAGGFNGGGSDTASTDTGGGGGGASDVRTRSASMGLSPDPRLIVAAGGGGGGSGNDSFGTSGFDGGTAGTAGTASGEFPGGGAGTATASGSGGCGAGCDGQFGSGGIGGGGSFGGGGGGGGYYGGGGGASGNFGGGSGGGGGSDLVPAGGTKAVAAASVAPRVEITYTPSTGPAVPAAPPKPTITAKVKPAKRRATFSFKSAGATGFRCSLVKRKHHRFSKPSFSTCRSPKRYKHLKRGRYSFDVQAVASGRVSPTANTHFKI